MPVRKRKRKHATAARELAEFIVERTAGSFDLSKPPSQEGDAPAPAKAPATPRMRGARRTRAPIVEPTGQATEIEPQSAGRSSRRRR